MLLPYTLGLIKTLLFRGVCFGSFNFNLYCYSTILLHFCITSLLLYYLTALLHYCLTTLLYYYICKWVTIRRYLGDWDHIWNEVSVSMKNLGSQSIHITLLYSHQMNIKRTSRKYYNEKVSDGILLILALVSDALQTLYLDGSMLPLLQLWYHTNA